MSGRRHYEYGTLDTGGPRHAYRERLMLQLLVHTVREGKVLDAGCGTGSLVLKLAALGFDVYGLDLSADSLEKARRKAEGSELDQPTALALGSVVQIPFAADTFEGIMCGEVLEHLHNDRRAVREMNRVLKPGGTCVVSVPADPTLYGLDDQWQGHLRRYTRRQLFGLFKESGFQVVQCRYWGFALTRAYRSLVYQGWVKTMRHRTPEAQRDSVFTALGLSPVWTRLLVRTFTLDEFLSGVSKGLGLVLAARKIDVRACATPDQSAEITT